MSLETTTETPPRMKVRPGVARHGGMVILALRGLRPFEPLRIQVQAEATDDRVEHLVSTDSRGVSIPRSACPTWAIAPNAGGLTPRPSSGPFALSLRKCMFSRACAAVRAGRSPADLQLP